MKKRNLIAVIVIAAMLLPTMTACGLLGNSASKDDGDANQEESFQEIVSSESGLAVSFPKSWRNAEGELNDVASIEMARESKEQYFIVIEDAAADFTDDMELQAFGDIVLGNMQGELVDAKTTEWADITVGDGTPAKQIELRGVINEVLKVTYLITVFEGADTYYQGICWSLDSTYAAGKPVFDEILASVKLPA
ncbi:MAG: hypothetical protein LBO81_05950 [Clostridiales Family XIII bacterium]|jgi:hypothetical protein|nr:hypothetical protein [Clostridiales Family XIII bacterium]